MLGRTHRIVVVLGLLFVAASVHADDRERARAAFREGSRHYNLGEFQQALEKFRDAYRQVDDASFLFNIAQCERQLGHKREAVREYRAYLNNTSAEAPNRETVRQIIAQLEKEIEEEQATAKKPPTGVLSPPVATAPSTTTEMASPSTSATTLTAMPTSTPTVTARAPERTPVYKKWWLWTIVGVAAGGLAAGLAVGLTHNDNPPSATTSLGTARPW